MGCVLKMEHITKTFPGVVALDDVSIELETGEVHAIVGENGAGKSTLMKVLSGIYQPDAGTIVFEGQEVKFHGALDALSRGIAIIHQELLPIPEMMVAENIFIGREPVKCGCIVDRPKLYKKTEELLSSLDITSFGAKTRMKDLSMAETQLVEIAKAISFSPKLLIMDEPTSSLTDTEVEKLYQIIEDLKGRGVTILYISHRMEELYRVADRVTVFRDGCYIGTRNMAEVNNAILIQMMVGRELTQMYPAKGNTVRNEIGLEVCELTDGKSIFDVSFAAHKGEVLGLAGLIGAGRTETVETIFGVRKRTGGEVLVNGERVEIRHPKDAIAHKIALVSEDRKRCGLNLVESVKFNMTLANLKAYCKNGVINQKKELQAAQEQMTSRNVKAASIRECVNSLSGGNQQKVVLGKWILINPDVIILDEPTRGIDVNAKAEIYKLIRELASEGKTIIMISSELPELIGMADRVVVMADGRKMGELEGDAITQEAIMALAANM